jgi:hypothetical protein
MGEIDTALDKLDEAVNRGWIVSPRIANSLPVFFELEGEPRYEAIQQRIIAHVNAERAKLDLEPVQLDRTLWMSLLEELIDEQNDPSMGHLHVATQTRGCASAPVNFALAHPCAKGG